MLQMADTPDGEHQISQGQEEQVKPWGAVEQSGEHQGRVNADEHCHENQGGAFHPFPRYALLILDELHTEQRHDSGSCRQPGAPDDHTPQNGVPGQCLPENGFR